MADKRIFCRFGFENCLDYLHLTDQAYVVISDVYSLFIYII